MTTDIDSLLLDRVFQPITDRATDVVTCFALARVSLTAALMVQTAALAWILATAHSLLLPMLAVTGCLATYVGAQQMRAQITRAERQVRPGMMNVRRVTMRMMRTAQLTGVFGAAALALLPGADVGCSCMLAANLCWLCSGYFLSCSTSHPARSSFGRLSPQVLKVSCCR